MQVRQGLCPFSHGADLLRSSAALIRGWVPDSGTAQRLLAKYNRLDLVMVLTLEGPRLLTKPQTEGKVRVHRDLYISMDCAGLVLAAAVKHRGKIQSMWMDMVAEWTARGSLCALMGCRRRDARQEVLDAVLSIPSVVSLRQRLLADAAARPVSEWVVLSHDATFQLLFKVIGQKKMQQGEGGFHALHTFVGRSGAVPGLSLQRCEGSEAFRCAVQEVLPEDARRTVRFVFSDSPGSILGAESVLPSLEAVGEDALHLVLRVEECFGERRCALSAELLRVQQKFRCPVGCPFEGVAGRPCAGKVAWPNKEAGTTPPPSEEWYSTPFASHEEYVSALHHLSVKYAGDMGRRNKRGRSVLQILQSGAARSHYVYLMDGARIIDRVRRLVGEAEQELMSWGTCGNEALHAQLKSSYATTVQQHVEAYPRQLQSFALAKMLAHHVAAYHPTIAQRGEGEILALLQGELRRGLVEGAPQEIRPRASRAELRAPVQRLDGSRVGARRRLKAQQAARWDAERERRAQRQRRRQAQKRRLKRTVYTKLKRLDSSGLVWCSRCSDVSAGCVSPRMSKWAPAMMTKLREEKEK